MSREAKMSHFTIKSDTIEYKLYCSLGDARRESRKFPGSKIYVKKILTGKLVEIK